MNRNDDMAHTIQPYTSGVLEKFRQGTIVATPVYRFANDFAAQLTEQQIQFDEWQTWAGPGMTYWYCFRLHRSESEAARFCGECGRPTSEPHCGFGESWH